MADYNVRAGNTWPPIEAELLHDTRVANISNYATVELRYRPKSGGAVVVRSAAVLNATDARVQYEWQPGETNIAGEYLGYFHVLYANGKTEDFPNLGFFTIAFTNGL